jgi:hypothetical protein
VAGMPKGYPSLPGWWNAAQSSGIGCPMPTHTLFVIPRSAATRNLLRLCFVTRGSSDRNLTPRPFQLRSSECAGRKNQVPEGQSSWVCLPYIALPGRVPLDFLQ